MAVRRVVFLLLAALALHVALAAPAPELIAVSRGLPSAQRGSESVELEPRAGVSTLASTAIASFTPYAQFVRAAYCDVAGWKCGGACKANPDFILYNTGGNGNSVPKWYTGYWPKESSVIIAHQGTDPTQFEALLTDLNLILKRPDRSLFPGLPSDVRVHDGFADAHAATAKTILTSVKKIMDDRKATKITIVGHSLGGAIALLDGLYLRLQLGNNVAIRMVTLGMPRVGNQQFADFVDATLPGALTRINNRQDLIPIVPGRFLGYRHPSGEVRITSPTTWVSCTGQDNTDRSCTIGAVPSLFSGNLLDHLGAYGNVFVGTTFCGQ